jgi:hypothetical protein
MSAFLASSTLTANMMALHFFHSGDTSDSLDARSCFAIGMELNVSYTRSIFCRLSDSIINRGNKTLNKKEYDFILSHPFFPRTSSAPARFFFRTVREKSIMRQKSIVHSVVATAVLSFLTLLSFLGTVYKLM